MAYRGFIYKHVNKLNDKVYIGQTIQDPEIRWGKAGTNYSGQRLFHRDIVKYGWDNFSHDILETIEEDSATKLKHKLNKLETKYILQYESVRANKGYNKALHNNIVSTVLTAKAKRCIEIYIENGFTLEESINAYITERDIKKHSINKKHRKRRD